MVFVGLLVLCIIAAKFGNGACCSMVQVEVCHVLFIVAVQYISSAEIAVTPPVGSTELPICPVCIGELVIIPCFSFLGINTS